jgi:hypothetical protein
MSRIIVIALLALLLSACQSDRFKDSHNDTSPLSRNG